MQASLARSLQTSRGPLLTHRTRTATLSGHCYHSRARQTLAPTLVTMGYRSSAREAISDAYHTVRRRRHADTPRHHAKEKIAIIGSGNWCPVDAPRAGQNVLTHPDSFDDHVPMYVHEEEINGRKLTEIINEEHENVKYLPGIKLPDNVQAIPDLAEAVDGATALIFVLPHQFIPSICRDLRGKIPKHGVKAISLIKGVDVKGTNIAIFADVIESLLNVSCSALSGANIADEVAKGAFSETTVGYRRKVDGVMWQKLFQNENFHVQIIDDVAGVSLCGALKNVVAVAAGFSDGLGWGNNSKAAIMRIGLLEMKKFSMEFFQGVRPETFVQESAGVADLITTCFGGRNRKCAEAYVKTGKPFDVLEKQLLNGQKLQGVETAREVHNFLQARGRVDEYPLFRTVYEIAYKSLEPSKITAKL
ncbi:uncharacterized protein L969DRAFT_53846 [Mixia osmundae IAM 14324]|uniref:uncharacterized protein n=1 Tax=Mixia osmundae (strain CBS 9802 / IAM 14324 / JCM 22182 / KY 12970) TaxID=764103 RepID=UPI0004A55776|nr:uncharacterized protein L969DRAFT_53846 [Mixia osmundae IAM 14324]KEI37033.1 hypothetical protein L969DRAFT_53846 [Mixia osmundae IAM 14324]